MGGGGLSEQIFARFPHANVYERQHLKGTRSTPGTFSACGRAGTQERGVVNLLTQRYPGPPKYDNDSKALREGWFERALAQLAKHDAFAGGSSCSIAFPRDIGCNLAGGDWAAYRRMIEGFARANPAVRVAIVSFGGPPGSKRARR